MQENDAALRKFVTRTYTSEGTERYSLYKSENEDDGHDDQGIVRINNGSYDVSYSTFTFRSIYSKKLFPVLAPIIVEKYASVRMQSILHNEEQDGGADRYAGFHGNEARRSVC